MFQIKITVLCCVLSLLFTGGVVLATKSALPVTVCYVTSWAVYRPDGGTFKVDDIDPSLCTHLVYAFAGLDNSTSSITSLDPWNDLTENYGKGSYKKITGLKSKNPQLKVILAVGGWNDGSENYSILAESATKRKTFVDSIIAFLKKFNFDGLDLHWKYPSQRGGKPEDKLNYVSLIQELKGELDKSGLILTAAISGVKYIIDSAYDLPSLNKYIDLVCLMSYDYHGSWDLQVAPNAPLRSKNKNDVLNVESSVKYLIKNGISPSKLVLGLPFFGRTFLLKDPQSTSNETLSKGFHGPLTKEDGYYGYNEICHELKVNRTSWTQWWDEETKTPFIRNNDKVISYDDARSIEEKVKLAASYKLAGVMVWTIDVDDFHGNCGETGKVNSTEPTTFPLLRSIKESLLTSYNITHFYQIVIVNIKKRN